MSTDCHGVASEVDAYTYAVMDVDSRKTEAGLRTFRLAQRGHAHRRDGGARLEASGIGRSTKPRLVFDVRGPGATGADHRGCPVASSGLHRTFIVFGGPPTQRINRLSVTGLDSRWSS
jgi:hypothetical protein